MFLCFFNLLIFYALRAVNVTSSNRRCRVNIVGGWDLNGIIPDHIMKRGFYINELAQQFLAIACRYR